MENIKLSYAERNLCSRRRDALLYVAARFMMVRIDMCAKRRRSSAEKQALKLV
jgi:hypothetical protein